jgi:hypothetical protein
MTIDPTLLVILNAFFGILNAFLAPVFSTIQEPYDNFVHTILGNLLGIVAK